MEIFDTLYEYILENYTLIGSKLLGDILHYVIEDTESPEQMYKVLYRLLGSLGLEEGELEREVKHDC
mgnify:FL=1